jgi:hypothetical protein
VVEILSHLSTRCLLLASQTSRFVYDIAAYLLHRRIRQALREERYQLIQECYIPSEKCMDTPDCRRGYAPCADDASRIFPVGELCFSDPFFLMEYNFRKLSWQERKLRGGREMTCCDGVSDGDARRVDTHPYTHCEYRGTYLGYDEPTGEGEDSLDERPGDPKSRHSSRSDGTSRSKLASPLSTFYTHFLPTKSSLAPPDDTPPTGSFAGTSDEPDGLASTTVSLDSGETFAQVCAQASLIKSGPKRGLFESVIPVFENFFRLKREYLDEALEEGSSSTGKIIWVDMNENVGLKVKVGSEEAKDANRNASLAEDAAASYKVYYQGMLPSLASITSST